MHKGQGRSLRALRRHCITHRHDSVIDITKWAQEYFQKPLLVNTIRHAICRYQLKLYHAKRKPCLNMVQKRRCVLWAKAHLKWTVSKWKSVLWSDKSTFDILVGNHGCSVLRAKEEGDLPACYQLSVQNPASLMVWGCINVYGMGSLHVLEGTTNVERYMKVLEQQYAPLQMTSISGKALRISAGQCKTTYCSYYNSMASWFKSPGAELTCLQSRTFTYRKHLAHH